MDSFDLSPDYYPAFLNLRGKKCVVIGGGKVAERKVSSLVRAGACVEVISPELTAALKRQKAAGAIYHIERQYRRGDLKGAFLAIAATGSSLVNREVSVEAPFLVNVADAPELSNFIMPSVMNRGPLTIAVSAGGASPALASAIRRDLESIFCREIGPYLLFLRKLRKDVIYTIGDRKARERFFKEMASQELLDILRDKGIRKAEKEVLKRLDDIKKAGGMPAKDKGQVNRND